MVLPLIPHLVLIGVGGFAGYLVRTLQEPKIREMVELVIPKVNMLISENSEIINEAIKLSHNKDVEAIVLRVLNDDLQQLEQDIIKKFPDTNKHLVVELIKVAIRNTTEIWDKYAVNLHLNRFFPWF